MKMFKTIILIGIIAVFNLCNECFAQYTKLLDFAGTTNGSYPGGSLISDGTFLYGMTYEGGTNNMGVVFKIKPDGTGYVKLLDFAGITNGKRPDGSLISDGTFQYGMTYEGGTNNMGVVFKIKPDGTGYIKLLDFAGVANGRGPWGDLISDGNFLYGMTEFGGTNDLGVIFKIKPDGSGYSKLLDFAGTTNGKEPWGSLISDGSYLYGMTYWGGINDMGVIFKIKPDGSGYLKLLDFAGVTNGKYPDGSLISDGTFLYGMTCYGGTNDMGVIFKIMPNGTGYAKLLDFAGNSNGRLPCGSLISDGNFLYGMTTEGGTNEMGVIFKIKPDGTGYTKLLDFAGITNGKRPDGSLISDGSFLYGMTCNGGTNNLGTVFKYAITGGIMENNIEKNFNIYPNPTNGIFNLEMNQFENVRINSITIYNILGEKVYETPSNSPKGGEFSLTIDLSSQPKGIYFAKLVLSGAEGNSEESYTEKIVIQ